MGAAGWDVGTVYNKIFVYYLIGSGNALLYRKNGDKPARGKYLCPRLVAKRRIASHSLKRPPNPRVG